MRIRISALMTCHNRREKTLASLSSLFKSQVLGLELTVFLTNDGSTDGTEEAVATKFPQVNILKGNGDLFWNRGMHRAFEAAMEFPTDYFLLLNDDTILYPNAIEKMLKTHQELFLQYQEPKIVVGAVRDAISGGLSYSGVIRTNKFRPVNFSRVEPSNVPTPCDTFNANCVLIPSAVAKLVGNLDVRFNHGMGDLDYGLRAKSLGCSLWVTPGFVGTCSLNSTEGTWQDSTLPIKVRMKKMLHPKGLPLVDWMQFTRRHAGSWWWAYWLYPYLKLILSSLLSIPTPKEN